METNISKQVFLPACTHNLASFWFNIQSRCGAQDSVKHKWPDCFLKGCDGWENKSGFPALAHSLLLCFSIQNSEHKSLSMFGQRRGLGWLFLFDTEVDVSWAQTFIHALWLRIDRLKCSLVATFSTKFRQVIVPEDDHFIFNLLCICVCVRVYVCVRLISWSMSMTVKVYTVDWCL